MKDIEKLFEEKLKNHRVAPPVQTWEKLQHQLHGKPRKLKVLYWKIAASVVLVMGAVVAVSIYLDHQRAQPSIVVLEKTIQELPEHTTHEESTNEKSKAEKFENTASEPGLPMARTEKESVQQVKKAKIPVVPDTRQENEDWSKPALLATVSRVEPNPLQSLETNELVIENHDFTRVRFISLDDENPPVKVIYKGVKPQEKNNPLEKTFAFLDQLKTSSISLSELRQAKDELVIKAFSANDHEEAGR